jgi:hypothetical protein
VAVIETGDPAVFVRAKLAGVCTPGVDAVTMYDPAVPFAVNIAEVATPDEFVTAVVDPPAKVPLAPDAGAVKVTTTPFTGLPPASVTVAVSRFPKDVLTAVLCPDPPVAAMAAAGPAVLVIVKLAGV